MKEHLIMITQCNFGDGDIDIKDYRPLDAQLVNFTQAPKAAHNFLPNNFQGWII